MDTQYGFSDISFLQALARARALEAADIEAARKAYPNPLPIIGMKATAKPFYAAPAPMV
jgi:hypothetical protein